MGILTLMEKFPCLSVLSFCPDTGIKTKSFKSVEGTLVVKSPEVFKGFSTTTSVCAKS